LQQAFPESKVEVREAKSRTKRIDVSVEKG